MNNPPIKISKAFQHLEVRNLGEGLNVGGFSSIGIRGKVWSLKHRGETYNFVRDDDGTPLSYLDVVIVGTAPYTSKIFYPPGEFDEDRAGAPICASIKGDKPDPGVSMPQSKTCAICTHNEWKNLPSGRRGKECQDNRRLAVLLMPKMTAKMLGSPLEEPVFFKVTPGSLRSFKTYCDSLIHQGLPFPAVVTRISFNPEKLFQMDFKVVEALSDAAAEIVLPLLQNTQTLQITGEAAVPQALPAPEEEEIAPPGAGSDDLMAAFGMAAFGQADAYGQAERLQPKRRGRPAGSVNRPKQIEAQAEPAPAPKEEAGNGQVEPWNESDSELDDAVVKLLGQRTQDMLK